MKAQTDKSNLPATAWLKENPAYYLVQDANQMLKLAFEASRKNDGDLERSFTRAAVLLYALAAEAFINMVYEYSESPANLREMSVRRKWLRASIECLPYHGRIELEGRIVYKPGDHIETFDPKSKLFLSYIELKNIRDDFVHLKPVFRDVPVKNLAASLIRKDVYPQTSIPKSLEQWQASHAEIAKRIFEQMVEKLNGFMKGTILCLLKSSAFIEMHESTFTEMFDAVED